LNRATPRRGKQKISLRPDLCPGYKSSSVVIKRERPKTGLRCSWPVGPDIPTLQQLIQVFTNAQVQGGGVAYVQTRLEQLPEVSTDDRAKLGDGARQNLDTTLRHLVDHNCRILLRSHCTKAQAARGC
jgi:hypothetical protein